MYTSLICIRQPMYRHADKERNFSTLAWTRKCENCNSLQFARLFLAECILHKVLFPSFRSNFWHSR